MVISNDVLITLRTIDDDICKDIAKTLTSKLNNVFLVGFPLSDSFANGYSKAIRLIVNLLLCRAELKEDVLKQINMVDLSYYENNSCKSCFADGFLHAVKQFKSEISTTLLNLHYNGI